MSSASTVITRKPFSLTYVTYDVDDKPLGPIWALFSLAPPFCVAALTVHTIVTRDLRGAFLLSGQIVTAICVVLLKEIIRQPRPSMYVANDEKEENEYGMPSNHAAFVSFCACFSIYFAITQYSHTTNENSGHRHSTLYKSAVKSLKRWAPPMAAVVIAIGCSYSRIHLGYHTSAQVLVGMILGCLIGTVYAKTYDGMYKTRFAPWIEQSWLGRDWDVRSYHDYFLISEDGEGNKQNSCDVAHFMAIRLDEYRQRSRLETNTKEKGG